MASEKRQFSNGVVDSSAEEKMLIDLSIFEDSNLFQHGFEETDFLEEERNCSETKDWSQDCHSVMLEPSRDWQLAGTYPLHKKRKDETTYSDVKQIPIIPVEGAAQHIHMMGKLVASMERSELSRQEILSQRRLSIPARDHHQANIILRQRRLSTTARYHHQANNSSKVEDHLP